MSSHMNVTVSTVKLAPGEYVVRSASDYTVAIGPPVQSILPAAIEGGSFKDVPWAPGRVGFRSPTMKVESVVTAPQEATFVVIPGNIISSVAFETVDIKRAEPRWLPSVDDPITADLIRVLDRAHQTLHEADRPLMTDAIGAALAVRMGQQLGAVPIKVDTPYPTGLPDNRLRAVVDYIEVNISKQLRLPELAGVAMLSTFHFARAFQKVMKIAPVRYVWQRRIERAKEALRRTREPLVAIAFDCGFSSQSHFTTAFKGAIGVTPAAYRAGLQMWMTAALTDWLDVVELGFPW